MQPTQLYLDTARLGQMSRCAQQSNIDLTRIASEEGASAFFESFLRDGSDSWPESLHSGFPGLCCWKGVRLAETKSSDARGKRSGRSPY